MLEPCVRTLSKAFDVLEHHHLRLKTGRQASEMLEQQVLRIVYEALPSIAVALARRAATQNR
jgi:hypothetical protein